MILKLNPKSNLPVDRALSLYGTLANRFETKGPVNGFPGIWWNCI